MKIRKSLTEKGITLVALVVTIIVLLILAGVTISLTLNNNGVIEKAQYASNTWANATKDEEKMMGEINDQVGTLSNINGKEESEEGSGGGDLAECTITDSGVKPSTPEAGATPLSTVKTTNLEDNKGNIVKVPKNFGIAYDSSDNVTEGIVIEYTGDDELKGNQYVWVPVGQTITKSNGDTIPAITLGRYDFDAKPNSSYTGVDGTGEATLKQDSANWSTQTGFVPTGKTWDAYEFSADDTAGNSYGNTKARNLSGFITSANSNHGYYIARYEAGISGTTDNDTNSTKADYNNIKPLSKKGVGLWNSITQPNAATACQNMHSGANSDLINSYAWDTAIVYIQNATGNTAYSKQNRGSNTSKVNTGATGDEQCKINDMAKNVYEWTTETSIASNPCIVRGGYYNVDTYFTAYRYNRSTTATGSNYGFRPILYL